MIITSNNWLYKLITINAHLDIKAFWVPFKYTAFKIPSEVKAIYVIKYSECSPGYDGTCDQPEEGWVRQRLIGKGLSPLYNVPSSSPEFVS